MSWFTVSSRFPSCTPSISLISHFSHVWFLNTSLPSHPTLYPGWHPRQVFDFCDWSGNEGRYTFVGRPIFRKRCLKFLLVKIQLIVTCICLRRTLCARFSGERRTVTSSHPQLICLSCITWHWKKLLDEQWTHNLDYERWYLYRCSLYAPCGIFADYEFRFVLQLSQTVAQYNRTTAFCNLWWHSCTVIFVGNNDKIH